MPCISFSCINWDFNCNDSKISEFEENASTISSSSAMLVEGFWWMPFTTLRKFSLILFFILLFFNLFILIYFWLHWVFVAAHGLSLAAVSRAYSSLRCEGFSLRWLLLLQSMGSRCTGFSSCGTWAQ